LRSRKKKKIRLGIEKTVEKKTKKMKEKKTKKKETKKNTKKSAILVASAPLWEGGPGTPKRKLWGAFPTRTIKNLRKGNFGAARNSKMESSGSLSKFGDVFDDKQNDDKSSK